MQEDSKVLSQLEGVQITFKRLYVHRDYNVDAEITITDEEELSPHILGPMRTSITKTWRSVISDLDAVSERGDWYQRLTQASILVQEANRVGAPIVALGTIEPPEPTREILQSIVFEGVPTLIFGPGGIGKSIIGLNFMSAIHHGREIAGLTAVQSNALVLDWETNESQTYHRQGEILTAWEVDPGRWPDPDAPDSERTGMVYYRFQSGPLWDDVELLSEAVARLNIGTVLIDSAGPACAGAPEDSAACLRFFQALRALSPHDKPLQSIILAHVTHAMRAGQAKSSPFGSVFWLNYPRQIWELQSAQDTGSSVAEFALHNRKSNLGPLQKAIGFRLRWDDGCSIEAMDIRSNAKLVAGMNLDERALILLRASPMVAVNNGSMARALSGVEMAKMLDVTEKALSPTLHSAKRFELVEGLWKETASGLDW